MNKKQAESHSDSSFRSKQRLSRTVCGILLSAGLPAHAFEVADLGHSTLHVDFMAHYGVFYSEKGYAGGLGSEAKPYRWREGAVLLGVELNPKEEGFYARLSTLGNASWGDGDPARSITGQDREMTDLEDAYLGYRSDSIGGSPWNLDISAGRQPLSLSNGFLVRNDRRLLAMQEAFSKASSVSLGRDGWRGRLAWFESATPWHAGTEMAALTLTHEHANGQVETTYLRGLDINHDEADPFIAQRDGMDVYHMHIEQRLMANALTLRGDVARQDKATSETAIALSPAWTFSEFTGQPTLSLGYARFSEGWDSLFHSQDRDNKWHGDVGENLAGPWNSNAEIWRLGLTGFVNERLKVAAFAYNYESLDTTQQPDMGGRELTLYAEWTPKDWLYVSPVLSWYDPDKSAAQGGIQLDDNDTSLVAYLEMWVFF